MEFQDAYSYARASKDQTGEELSVERQLVDQDERAPKLGLRVVHKYVDNHVSAAGRKSRPQFEAMLKALRNNGVRAVISTDMTRLTRGKALDEVRLLELGVEIGLKLFFVRAPDMDLSTAAGRMVASVLIAQARLEIEQKSERQRRAAVQAAESGKRIGGRRPFGYGKIVGVDERTKEPIRDYNQFVLPEKNAIKKAYDDIQAGVSLGKVARNWNAAGLYGDQVRRRKGHEGEPSPWTSQSVRIVLLNPRNAGLRSHVTEDTLKRMHPVKARIEGIVGKAEWPAIIPEKQWRAVVEILLDPDRTSAPRSSAGLLTGIARCGVCEAEGRTTTVHQGGGPAGYRTYRCSEAWGHVVRKAEPVEQYVGEVVVARLSRPDAVDLLTQPSGVDVKELRRRLRGVRKRMNAQAALHAAEEIDDQQLRAGTAVLRREKQEIEAQLAEAGRVSVLGPLINAPDVGAAWQQMAKDVERQRAVVDELMTVTLMPPGRGTRTFRPETVICRPRR